LLSRTEVNVILFFVILFVALGIFSPNFLDLFNLVNLTRQISLYAIIAVGETLVMTLGGIDLSVGSVLALAGVLSAIFRLSLGNLAIVMAIGVGVACGLANGFLVSKLRINPFIVTLGMLNIARGIVLVITKGFPIPIYEGSIITLGQGSFFSVPYLFLFMLGVGILGIFLLGRTTYGNYVKAIGSNESAAWAMGIDVQRIKITTYTISGLLSGLAGVLLAGRLSAGQANAGIGWELDVIAAVIIGGTSLAGGEGSVLGTLFGAALLGIIRNGLVLFGVSMYWQTIVIGLILVGGVALGTLRELRG
jgi:ribose/xylose/arabinose/galactoside ABC-type transport system permease subunit